jgi:hypothetical protein
MKKILLILLALVVLIQLIRPKKNHQEVDASKQIAAVLDVPADVQSILKRSCNDCHSNQTNYLWYHEIAPMSWMVAHHIKEGKEHINFDEFASYNARQKAHALEEIAEVVEHGEMPMKGYVVFHPETALSQSDIEKIKTWASTAGSKTVVAKNTDSATQEDCEKEGKMPEEGCEKKGKSCCKSGF